MRSYLPQSAWNMARHIREHSNKSQVIILHNQKMSIPLSASERALNRKLGIMWVPYDNAVRPTIQADFITFCNLADHVEHELEWDHVVLSPVRSLAGESLENSKNTRSGPQRRPVYYRASCQGSAGDGGA